jgi:chloramphenicol 3-O phosphotransferase
MHKRKKSMMLCIGLVCIVLSITNSYGATIIFLNGTSSAGKTSIAQALQKYLQEPYFHIGIDHFLAMLPPQYSEYGEHAAKGVQFSRSLNDDGHPIITVQLGPLGTTLLKNMQQTCYNFAQQGCNLIIDEVILSTERSLSYLELFADFNVYCIGVKPPIHVSVQREQTRGDREIGLARGLFECVHQDMIYDLELDTEKLSSDQCAMLIRERILSSEKPEAFNSMRTKKRAPVDARQ